MLYLSHGDAVSPDDFFKNFTLGFYQEMRGVRVRVGVGADRICDTPLSYTIIYISHNELHRRRRSYARVRVNSV